MNAFEDGSAAPAPRCGAEQRVGGGARVCFREPGHEPPHGDGGAEWTDADAYGDQPNPRVLKPEDVRTE